MERTLNKITDITNEYSQRCNELNTEAQEIDQIIAEKVKLVEEQKAKELQAKAEALAKEKNTPDKVLPLETK